MIFLGPLYQPKDEEKILENCKSSISNAPNQFQTRLLNGFIQNDISVNILNVLPVGAFAKSYKKLILPNREWLFFGNRSYEIGGLNLPFIKQWQRKVKTKKLLSKLTKQNKEIIIYSTYLPFLQAVYKFPKEVKITLIVTDLPEFYDLGKTSWLKKYFRKRNNKKIYKCLSRIDKFVLLTEDMKGPLQVGERPYVVVEGISSETVTAPLLKNEVNVIEKEIIFYSGTLHYQFGIKQLVEAFQSLKNSNAELWICGGGEAGGWIEKLAKQNSKIRYFGFVTSERVRELRKNATVLVNPRPNKGAYTKYSFPSKTMEYMASGIPVIMHKLKGIPSEYDNYLVYIEEDTAESLKLAIEEVFAMNKERRQAFGDAAREFILQNKNEYVQAKKILDMIYNFRCL